MIETVSSICTINPPHLRMGVKQYRLHVYWKKIAPDILKLVGVSKTRIKDLLRVLVFYERSIPGRESLLQWFSAAGEVLENA